jgi:hypothetical protein
MPAEGLLASAKTARGGVNMLVIIVAFVLSVMVIQTHNSCSNQDQKFKSDTQISFTVALIVVIGACLLFAYDLGVMFDFIK